MFNQRQETKINEKLSFYDYIGNNPAKWGLFRAGSIKGLLYFDW
jgi:hypothetical protein